MNITIIFEILNIIIATFASLLGIIGKAMFSIYNTLDSIKETFIASAFGIPVMVVSALSIIIGAINFFLKISSKH